MATTTKMTSLIARATGLTTLLISIPLLSGCPMKDHDSELPRFTQLEAFNPHRPTFECKHEAAVNPPISPEAEALFQQALTLTSYELWPKDRDYAKAADLYEQAMKLGHWKAQFNLAGAYLHGTGVAQDVEKAIQLTEDLMRKGVPAAWDNMGAYYMGGIGGLKRDATVAYAFWQKAADMGSMAAQTYIGEKLTATHDEPPSFWGNRPIGLKMLECAFTQGSGKAALELGVALNGNNPSLNEDYARALNVLHEGVKLGSEDSANYLSSSFRRGEDLVNKFKDIARSERYGILADALYTHPDLRFPNLDKVLPLPPARLPMWDGKKESLINAAKAVVPAPAAPPKPTSNPASQRTGRAHISEGWTLPDKPQVDVPVQYEYTYVPESGYYLAQLMRHSTDRHHTWDAEQVPIYYRKGESFDRTRPGLKDEDGRIVFHYLGLAVPIPKPAVLDDHPLVARSIARYVDVPEPIRRCKGHQTCPATGIWAAQVPDGHPLAVVFNQWHQQTYVMEGQKFQSQHLDIDARDVSWSWLGQANDQRSEDVVYLRVDGPAATTAGDEADGDADANKVTAARPGQRIPLGEHVATGHTCPQSGWWECMDKGKVQGDRRQFFRSGELMPRAVVLGKRTMLEKLKGEQPLYLVTTEWKLVEHDQPPARSSI